MLNKQLLIINKSTFLENIVYYWLDYYRLNYHKADICVFE